MYHLFHCCFISRFWGHWWIHIVQSRLLHCAIIYNLWRLRYRRLWLEYCLFDVDACLYFLTAFQLLKCNDFSIDGFWFKHIVALRVHRLSGTKQSLIVILFVTTIDVSGHICLGVKHRYVCDGLICNEVMDRRSVNIGFTPGWVGPTSKRCLYAPNFTNFQQPVGPDVLAPFRQFILD